MSWWDGRLVAFDIESTSIDIESARIVSAAIVVCGGGVATEKLVLLSDVDGQEIPEEATAVHGITTEKAHAEGEPAHDVIEQVVHTLVACVDWPLVVFRASYDLSVLDREARRYGIPPLFDRCSPTVIDPSVLDKHLDRYRKGLRTLAATCEHYKAGLDDAHDAASDALAAARLAYVLGKRGEVVRRVWNAQTGAEKAALVHHWDSVRGDLKLLHAAQRTWHEDQMRSLTRHFEEKGEPKTIPTDWPLIPAKVLAKVSA